MRASTRDLAGPRPRHLRPAAEIFATRRQPVRHELVTHVLGTICHPCVRAGQDRNGGEGGIRTHDTVARTPHFECGTFNHSATSPSGPKSGSGAPRRGQVIRESRSGNKLCRMRSGGDFPLRRRYGTAATAAHSLLVGRLVNRAFPSPVPIVSTPQCLTSRMYGTSLRPCTTASLCIRIATS
jgi:hypothetical protein